MKKVKTSFSLTPKTNQLIDILAKKLEISKTSVVTLAIKYFAEEENINIDDIEKQRDSIKPN